MLHAVLFASLFLIPQSTGFQLRLSPQSRQPSAIKFSSQFPYQSLKETQLQLFSITDFSPSFSAGLTLVLSSSFGFMYDRLNLLSLKGRRSKKQRTIGGEDDKGKEQEEEKEGHANAGTIVTLVTAALITNASSSSSSLFSWLNVPTSHPFYDLCWTKFLPASLALTLLSTVTDEHSSSVSTDGVLVAEYDDDNTNTLVTKRRNRSSSLTKNIIIAVSIPFLVGSIGSILGCVLSALILGLRMMNPVEASIAAGCLCASFIGGSVNFFATARILSSQILPSMASIPSSSSGVGDNFMISNLFSSMAAADLIIMALYFGGMTATLSWKRMRLWFPGRFEQNSSLHSYDEEESFRMDHSNENATRHASNSSDDQSLSNKMSSVLFATMLSWIIVEMSIVFEKYTSSFVPGMACAAVAALGTGVNSLLQMVPQVKNNDSVSIPNKVATTSSKSSHILLRSKIDITLKRIQQIMFYMIRDLHKVTIPMSDMCFHLLFAAIGTTANLKQALSNGPSCFIFAAMALSTHVFVICAGSLGVMRIHEFFQNRKKESARETTDVNDNKATTDDEREKILPFAVEEVLVASNALIGGASTAAAFAGNLGGGEGKELGISDERKNALVIAATIWGVIGYACATSIGIAISRFMLLLFQTR